MKQIFLLIGLIFTLASCSLPTTSHMTVSSETRTVATPTYGSGKHMLELFADFQCPACINFHKTLAPIIEGYAAKGQLTIVYRQFPLTEIHKNAYRDAIAGLCGAEQGKYMDYKKSLYALEEGKAWATTTDDDRVATAKSAGLDGDKLSACLASDAYKAQVDADMAYGDSLHVNGTPSLFLDNKKLDLSVFRDIDMFKTFMDRVVAE